eukprot:scaffold50327_cov50-Attheya_sp.AAC.1
MERKNKCHLACHGERLDSTPTHPNQTNQTAAAPMDFTVRSCMNALMDQEIDPEKCKEPEISNIIDTFCADA